ncbi:MAG: hypothetical protein AB7L28_23410, partial [Kofleriaceae bacterium]
MTKPAPPAPPEGDASPAGQELEIEADGIDEWNGDQFTPQVQSQKIDALIKETAAAASRGSGSGVANPFEAATVRRITTATTPRKTPPAGSPMPSGATPAKGSPARITTSAEPRATTAPGAIPTGSASAPRANTAPGAIPSGSASAPRANTAPDAIPSGSSSAPRARTAPGPISSDSSRSPRAKTAPGEPSNDASIRAAAPPSRAHTPAGASASPRATTSATGPRA